MTDTSPLGDMLAFYTKECGQLRAVLLKREAALRQLGSDIVALTGASVQVCGGDGDALHPSDVPGLVVDCVTLLRRDYDAQLAKKDEALRSIEAAASNRENRAVVAAARTTLRSIADWAREALGVKP